MFYFYSTSSLSNLSFCSKVEQKKVNINKMKDEAARDIFKIKWRIRQASLCWLCFSQYCKKIEWSDTRPILVATKLIFNIIFLRNFVYCFLHDCCCLHRERWDCNETCVSCVRPCKVAALTSVFLLLPVCLHTCFSNWSHFASSHITAILFLRLPLYLQRSL